MVLKRNQLADSLISYFLFPETMSRKLHDLYWATHFVVFIMVILVISHMYHICICIIIFIYSDMNPKLRIFRICQDHDWVNLKRPSINPRLFNSQSLFLLRGLRTSFALPSPLPKGNKKRVGRIISFMIHKQIYYIWMIAKLLGSIQNIWVEQVGVPLLP